MRFSEHNEEWISIDLRIIICIILPVYFPYIMRNRNADNKRRTLF
jgi:hypothetical protein